MAAGDKDVKLLIRARDEASSALKAVTGALKDVAKASAATGGSAEETGNVLTDLGRQVAKLKTEMSALSTLERSTEILDKMTSTIERMKSEFATAGDDVEKYKAALASTAEALNTSSANLARLREALKESSGQGRQAAADQSAIQRELKNSERAYAALQERVKAGRKALADSGAEIASLKDKIAPSVSRTAELKAATDELSAAYKKSRDELRIATSEQSAIQTELAKTEKAYDALQARIAGGHTVRNKDQRLGDMGSQMASLQAQLEPAIAKTERLRAQTEDLAKAYQTSREQLKLATSEQTAIQQQLGRSEKAYADLQARVEGSGKTIGDSQNLAAMAAEVDALRARLEPAVAKTAQLQSATAALATEYKIEKTNLATLNAEYAKVERQADRASATQNQLSQAIARGEAEFDGFKAVANEVATALGQVELSQEEVARTSQLVAAETERLTVVMAQMNRFSDGMGNFIDPGNAKIIRQQKEEVDRAKVALESLRAEEARLKAAMSEATVVSEKEQAALRAVGAAARAADAELKGHIDQLQRVIVAYRTTGSAASDLKTKTSGGVFSSVYGESRQALGFFQRMRSELLALTQSYVGFFAVIEGGRRVIDTYAVIQSAQGKLRVAFGDDAQVIAGQMAWLERQAAKLGVSFGDLATNYTDFAVAASDAHFDGSSIQKIFMSVTAAGRVMRLNADDMQGVFKAITQMVSKGKISAEELRGQLGDRLSGAFNLFANAIGVSAAELDNLMKKGEVLADRSTMLQVADKLAEKFGPQLERALEQTDAQLGKFQNNLFQAARRVGEAGFMESFNKLLQEMNAWFDTPDGIRFFQGLGSAASTAIDVVAVLATNLDLVKTTIELLVATKLSSWLMAAVGQFAAIQREQQLAAQATAALGASTEVAAAKMGGFSATVAAVRASLMQLRAAYAEAGVAAVGVATRSVTLRAAMMASSATMAAVTGITNGLAFAFRALWVAVGGWAGLLVTGAIFLLGEVIGHVSSSVSESTQLIEENRVALGKLGDAYEDASKKGTSFAASLKNLSLTEVQAQLRRTQTEIDALKSKIGVGFFELIGTGGARLDPLTESLVGLRGQLASGKIDANQFIAAIDELSKQKGVSTEQMVALQKQARQMLELQDQAKQLALANKVLTGTASDAEKQAYALTQGLGAVAEAADTASNAAGKFSDALDEIKSTIPGLANELKKMKELEKLDEAWGTILKAGPPTPENYRLYQQGRAAIDSKYTDYEKQYTDQTGPRATQLDAIVAGAARVAEQLGVSAKDILTAISYESGFNPRVMGGKGGNYYGLIQFSPDNQKRYGLNGQESLDTQFEAITKYLKSAGVKPGDNLLRIYSAISAGDASKINASDANNGGRPGDNEFKVNYDMDTHAAKAEGLLKSRQGLAKQAEDQVKQEQRLSEEQAKQAEATKKQITDNDEEIRQAGMIADGKERQAAIEKAVADAREKNKNISEEDLNRIRDQAAALYDVQHKYDGEKKAQEDVNRLLSLRKELMDQLKTAQDTGDGSRAQELKDHLKGVNAELSTAIENAIALNKQLGGPDADLNIAKLEGLKLTVADLGQTSIITRDQLANMITDNFMSALDELFQTIASGEFTLADLGKAFQKFVAQTLIDIGKMIVKSMILWAVQSALGIAGPMPTLGGMFTSAATRHTGGRVNRSGNSRQVNPLLFVGAPRYHKGGVAGLAPGEVPTILKENEIVDPGDGSVFQKYFGQQAPAKTNLKIINAFDTASVVSEGLGTAAGEEALMNFVTRKASDIRGALG